MKAILLKHSILITPNHAIVLRALLRRRGDVAAAGAIGRGSLAVRRVLVDGTRRDAQLFTVVRLVAVKNRCRARAGPRLQAIAQRGTDLKSALCRTLVVSLPHLTPIL
ncbi:hypothetical protein EVAR_35334_1 [Eumeta japonica]|uniref:Uncharacterized protein n=1 Tax=Eumeta variegata TaxID=151549 RepID=A0A4C1XLR4_EUMVA|nr:hypothetical protein EVAR_35334_1 [Eumeta japonica]